PTASGLVPPPAPGSAAPPGDALVPPAPASSISRRAGNRSRISSARSGWARAYSAGSGRSPRRWRARKSSASSSTGLRRASGSVTVAVLRLVGHAREDLLQSLQGSHVAVAGHRLRDFQ